MMKHLSPAYKAAVAGLLVAVSAILTGPLAIPLNLFGGYMKSISFGVIPVMFAGIALGPVMGGCVGAAADVLGVLLFPKGAYFPGFTVVYALIGILPALMLRKEAIPPRLSRLSVSVAITHLICSLGLNTFFLVYFLKLSPEIMWVRALVQCVMVPIYIAILYALLKAVPKLKIRS